VFSLLRYGEIKMCMIDNIAGAISNCLNYIIRLDEIPVSLTVTYPMSRSGRKRSRSQTVTWTAVSGQSCLEGAHGNMRD